MVNLWIDKEGSIGLEFRGGLRQTKAKCVSAINSCAKVEGVFNH